MFYLYAFNRNAVSNTACHESSFFLCTCLNWDCSWQMSKVSISFWSYYYCPAMANIADCCCQMAISTQESVQILLSSLRKNRAQCLINLLTSFSFMYCSSCNKLISLFFSLGNLTWKVQSLSVQTEPLDHLVWTISDYHLAQRGRHWEVSGRLFYQCLYLP